MKHCPTCKTNYADDTLQYCLEDGTPLVATFDSQAPTVALSDTSAETILKGGEPAPTQVAVPPTEIWQPPQSEVTQVKPHPQQFQFQAPPPSQQPKRSNTALAVGLTALVMFLLFGGIFGAWLLMRDSGTNNKNKIDVNIYSPSASPTVSPGESVSPSPTASASVSPTPTATPSFDAEQVKTDVRNRMNLWKSSMESGSLDAVMSHYASRLDYYYGAGSTTSAYVRQNKKRAFDLYYSFSVSMSNMDITLDSTGEKATVRFVKSWNFRGSTDDSKGSVRAQFQVTKIGSLWLITGEKDV